MSLASWFSKTGLFKVLNRGWKGITYNGRPLFSDLAKQVSDSLPDVIKGATGSGLTTSQREKIGAETDAQRLLNEEDFQRKIDFYERFESPAAQVRQYKDAGLNPALMFDSAPGVSASGGVGPGSAGSAGDSGVEVAGLLSLFGNLINTAANYNIRNSQLEVERSLGEQRIALEKYKADEQVEYWKILAGESESRTLLNGAKLHQVLADTRAREILNWFLPQQQTADLAQKHALTSEAWERIQNHQKEREVMDGKLREIAAHVLELNSQVSLNSARSKQILQSIENLKQEFIKVGKEIGLLDKDIENYAFNHARIINERGGVNILGSGGNFGSGKVVLPDGSVVDSPGSSFSPSAADVFGSFAPTGSPSWWDHLLNP